MFSAWVGLAVDTGVHSFAVAVTLCAVDKQILQGLLLLACCLQNTRPVF